MSQKHTIPEKKELQIYNYDSKIGRTWFLIKKETSSANTLLIQKYDNLMIRLALAKATRLKHLLKSLD